LVAEDEWEENTWYFQMIAAQERQEIELRKAKKGDENEQRKVVI
jgi:hypothetical protein